MGSMGGERLVVVGADAGGMTAASQARRRRGADELQIVAVDRGRHASYSACGIPYWIGGTVSTVDALVTRTVEAFRKQDIEVRLRTEAVGLDLDAREVLVRDLDGGGESRLGFDQLVLGTGAVPVRPEIPGVGAPGVFGVQTLDDGEAVRAAVAADGARRAVVVGGGYIGLEMAEAFVQRGMEVTVVEAAEQPMSTLDPDMGVLVAEAIDGLGITLLRGEPVTAIATGSDGRARAVVTASPGDPGRRGRARAGCRAEHLARPRRRREDRCQRRDRDRRPDADRLARRGVGGRRLRRDGRPGLPPAGRGGPRHPRQQAGSGGRDQPGRRLRDLPRDRRHRGHQGL